LDRTETIITDLDRAFGELKRPKDTELLHVDCFDNSDIKPFYGEKHWREIPDEMIESQNGALCFFSPQAFRFFLPAYMRYCLRNYVDSQSFSVDATIYALNPHGSGQKDFMESKWGLFSSDQLGVVVSFLKFMSEQEEYVDADAAKSALANYWLKDAHKST